MNLNGAHTKEASRPESICLECGFCCNGVIFADVKLQPGDAQKLIARGLPLPHATPARAKPRLPQPCPAYDCSRCTVYEDRPTYCRQFDCLLLKSVKDRKTSPAAALQIIRKARRHVERVKELLRNLGDTDESAALALRFKRTARRLEKGGLDKNSAELFGELTLSFHELNCILSDRFYPGS